MQVVFQIFTVLAFVTVACSAKASLWYAGFSSSTLQEDALNFVKCCHKALDGGLPSAGIPDHNPLKIRNITYDLSESNQVVNFNIFNMELDGLLDYTLTNVSAIVYENPDRVYYTYNFTWPLLTLTGNWSLNGDGSLSLLNIGGLFSLGMEWVSFVGFWNMTLPNQASVKEHLDDYELNIAVGDVKAHVTGLPDSVTDAFLSEGLKSGLNNIPKEQVSEALKARFNEFWIENPDKIDAIIANCQS